MIQTQCTKCGKRFRVDGSRIPGPKAKFHCTVCQNIVYVIKPDHKIQPTPKIVPWHEQTTILKRESYFDSGEWERMKIPVAIEQKSSRFGFAAKLLILIMMLSLVPLITFLAIYWKQMESRAKSDTEQMQAQITDRLADHVNTWIDKNIRVLQTAAQIPDITSMTPKHQQPTLKAVRQACPWMEVVYTIDLNGLNVARSDERSLENDAGQAYYRDILNGQEVGWQTSIHKTTKEPVMTLAVPIKANGKLIGMLVNSMGLKEIIGPIMDYRQGRTGYAFLLDANGKVMAHPNKDHSLKQKNLNQHPMVAAYKQGRHGSIYVRDIKEVDTIGYVKSTSFGWILVVQQEAREALKIIRQSDYATYLIFAASLLLVILGAWLATRIFTKPLAELSRLANRMSLGDLNVDLESDAKDEIGQLSKSLSRMQASLKLSIEALDRLA